MENRDLSVEKIYKPRSGKTLRASIVFMVLGVVAVFSLRTEVAKCIASGGHLSGDLIFLLFGSIFMMGMSLLLLVGALRGLPRLIVSSRQVRFEAALGTRWAEWNSLSPFIQVKRSIGRANRTMAFAKANIMGKNVSRNLLKKKTLEIPNVFDADIDQIITHLNMRRTETVGATDAAPGPAQEPTQLIGVPGTKTPWVTYGILAVLVVIFACECLFGITPAKDLTPSLFTVIAFGALGHTIVLDTGEWYRFVTAPLLHGGVAHILLNGIALLMVGHALERLLGRAWLFAIFFIGAVAGSLMSFTINAPEVTSVGASGAIMGLFAALFICSFHIEASAPRVRMQSLALRTLVPSLLPLATAHEHIDYGAHLGGALGGAAIGFIILKSWPAASPLPPLRKLALDIGIAGLILFALGGMAVVNHFPNYQKLAQLIPPGELPKGRAEEIAQADNLVARYPNDPRAHTFKAFKLVTNHDLPGAQHELETALAEFQSLHFVFSQNIELATQGELAVVLLGENQQAEAKKMAAPICQATNLSDALGKMADILKSQHLCDEGKP